MADRVILGDIATPIAVFDSTDIRTITYSSTVDAVGSELSIDVFTPTVDYPYTPDSYQIVGGVDFLGIYSSDGYLMCTNKQFYDLRLIEYGTQVRYYRDNVLTVKAYVKNVVRVGQGTYRINAISAIGLLDTQKHYGGMYNATTFGAVLSDIIGASVPYTVDADVAAISIYGDYLPYGTKRSNLHELLFGYGVSVRRNANGDMNFAMLTNDVEAIVPDNRIYINGEVDYSALATEAQVTEHAFVQLAGDETVTEFDNTNGGETANHTFIAFRNAPLYNLTVTGTLTIEESNCNYAIVSGIGVLSGTKYTHTTRVLAVQAQDAGTREQNIVSVTDCTTITVLNSAAVADRLLAYYASKRTIHSGIVLDGENAGDFITAKDAYMDTISGFIQTMNVNVSTINKADATIITDYIPTGGNNYTQSEVVTTSGTWTAAKTGKHQISIVSGGQGGQGGHCGRCNLDGSASSVAGAGGEPSNGGSGGRVVTFTINLTAGDTLVFALGSGGAGGAGAARDTFSTWNNPPQPSDGALGADTTVTQNGVVIYSTATGVAAPYGLTDIFTGNTYALSGANSQAGASGGAAYKKGEDYIDGAYLWHGGAANTAGGGGAAYGANGGVGYPIYDEGDIDGYKGGAGADALAKVVAANLGCGGAGGNAGGGAGQAVHGTFWTSLLANGGAGAAGNTGGAGFALIYS